MNYPSYREHSDFAAVLPDFFKMKIQFFDIPSNMEKL